MAALLGFVHARFQLVQIGAQQPLQLGFDFGETAARLADATDHANQFRARAFAFNGFGAVLVRRENLFEARFVAKLVGLIRVGHQLLALGAVVAVGGEIGMDAPRDLAIQALHFG